jgi:hypothetical protein
MKTSPTYDLSQPEKNGVDLKIRLEDLGESVLEK